MATRASNGIGVISLEAIFAVWGSWAMFVTPSLNIRSMIRRRGTHGYSVASRVPEAELGAHRRLPERAGRNRLQSVIC
jgi:hypothetical protein